MCSRIHIAGSFRLAYASLFNSKMALRASSSYKHAMSQTGHCSVQVVFYLDVCGGSCAIVLFCCHRYCARFHLLLSFLFCCCFVGGHSMDVVVLRDMMRIHKITAGRANRQPWTSSTTCDRGLPFHCHEIKQDGAYVYEKRRKRKQKYCLLNFRPLLLFVNGPDFSVTPSSRCIIMTVVYTSFDVDLAIVQCFCAGGPFFFAVFVLLSCWTVDWIW